MGESRGASDRSRPGGAARAAGAAPPPGRAAGWWPVALAALRQRLPIRWRLTLWYVALLAATLLLFSAALFGGLHKRLHEALDDTVRNQAAQAQGGVRVEDGALRLATNPGTDPRQREHVVRLFDRAGALIAATGTSSETIPSTRGDVAAALAGETRWGWAEVADARVRLLTEPVTVDGRVVGALQVAAFERDIARTLQLTALLLGTVGPLTLIVASLGGYALAGRALAPVDRITRLAGAIGEADLGRRLDLALPRDEIGRLARTFNAMLDRLEAAFARQRQFAADASHELRTPLSLVRGQLELALARPRDPAADQAVLEELAEDVERLARLAQTLLMLARSDAGALRLSEDAVDLAVLVDLVAEQYGAAAAAAGVRLATAVEPTTIDADEDRLIQVLVNLTDNALRYAPAGTTVTLGCRADAGTAAFWVADAGPGIPAEHLPRLFDRFYRADPGRDRARGGIGLGLSISKEIVEVHGGTIVVESAPGAGTTVLVTLPRAAANRRGRPVPHGADRMAPTSGSARRG